MKALLLVYPLLCSSVAAQQPTTRSTEPAPLPFNTIESIAAVVPSTVTLRTGGKWSIVGVEQANEAVKAKALNRPARLRLKVAVFQPFKEHGWGYRIMAPDDDVPTTAVAGRCSHRCLTFGGESCSDSNGGNPLPSTTRCSCIRSPSSLASVQRDHAERATPPGS